MWKAIVILDNVLLDSADSATVIQSLTAEVKGVGRTGWVNIHTDKIFETEKIRCIHHSLHIVLHFLLRLFCPHEEEVELLSDEAKRYM
ncbi:hypothetical protein ANCDUO_22930 [Ancylostoma duodenale]|uniref:Uncharacterized protein n=1 Tax=Ancylostoma duodenale TaxID=51022 RepID=A0A0C2BT09_9BILA|nr:hypothetical protein ANCDUO_22930 [Ancylostoma duodenale]